MSDTTETETETNTNTDEPTKAELHDRVRKLESTVEKLMPSRRDALKLGAAGIAGAAGLSAASGSAEASTGSAGTIGSASDRPTIFADDIDANDATVGNNAVLTADATSTDENLSFGSFNVINNSNPTVLLVTVVVETDGTTRGRVNLEVDESGGNNPDYKAVFAWSDANFPAGTRQYENKSFYLPAGASIKFENKSDPTGNNEIQLSRSYTL